MIRTIIFRRQPGVDDCQIWRDGITGNHRRQTAPGHIGAALLLKHQRLACQRLRMIR